MTTKATTAQWFLSLDTYCPSCEAAFDLLDDPDFWSVRGLQPCENHTKNSCGVEVSCPHCRHEFTVDMEY